MKVIFFGNSAYCLPVLGTLVKNFDLKLVITRPDKPIGRKKILTPSAPKTWARQHNIAVTSPETLKKDTPDRIKVIKIINDIQSDLAVVSDYGLIIPEGVFTLPKLGAINIHFSKLPDLRGPSPVQSALLRGDTTAWITIFALEKTLDTGPILWQKPYPIDPDDTTQTLYTRLFHEAAKVLPDIIKDYALGKIKPVPQDHSKATYTKFLTRDDGFVDWKTLPNAGPEIYNRYRATFPWPGLWTLRQTQGKPIRMKILRCHLEDKKLVLDQIQFEGQKPENTRG